jgi:ActR/RegA family two-component response regulator
VFYFGLNLIQTITRVSPQVILLMVTQFALATVTAETIKGTACSYDPRRSNSIGRVGEHQEHARVLKH